jgi:hypothetical protein
MTEAEEIHEGGCLCGAVRYAARGRPTHVNYCHCRMCLKATGAPVSAWATFPSARVTFTKSAPTLRRSSAIAQRGFCATCGSALTWQGDERADLVDLSVGTLDRPERVSPQDHLWTESAVPWLHIEDDLPRYPRSRGG